MKNYITILTFLLSTLASAQTKDSRAKVEIRGRVNEISVSPDEKIWLVTAMGETYHADSIQSDWYTGKTLVKGNSENGYSYEQHLERISFFNKDTAMITGYIAVSNKVPKSNGYYLTQDGGKTLKLLDYGGNSWIYAIYTDNSGHAWMGGSSKDLYYSHDFGKSWTTLKMSYKSSDRTYGIFMSTAKSGIAGSDGNEILTTEDNWKTVTQMQTPFDQKKYKNVEGSYADNRISKILKWNNYIVIKQAGRIFYSDEKIIEWKTFPIAIIDFEIDVESQKLFAVTSGLNVITFDSPDTFKMISDKTLADYPIDIKVVNHSLYAVDNQNRICKVNNEEFICTFPYSADEKITQPDIVRKTKTLSWGKDGDQLYIADDDRYNWYRENTFDFWIDDLTLLSDSVAILWDGSKNNYLYFLKDHTARLYQLKDPLESFLGVPVTSFSVSSGSRGCYHHAEDEIRYERLNDSTFKTLTYTSDKSYDKELAVFQNRVNSKLLAMILDSINCNPYAIPSLKDFHITEADKEKYLKTVDEQVEGKTYWFGDRKKINKKFYYTVPAMLDTLNDSITATILNQREHWTSTTSHWFSIRIINQNNDTLNIYRSYYVNTLPWHLPWKCEYKGIHFNCYDIELSRFINSCIPDDFMDKEVFDNSVLIMEIAHYLYKEE